MVVKPAVLIFLGISFFVQLKRTEYVWGVGKELFRWTVAWPTFYGIYKTWSSQKQELWVVSAECGQPEIADVGKTHGWLSRNGQRKLSSGCWNVVFFFKKVDLFTHHSSASQQEGHRFSCNFSCCVFCVWRSSLGVLRLSCHSPQTCTVHWVDWNPLGLTETLLG